MPRAFKLTVTYQNDEEVLETMVWYVDFSSLDPVNMLDMQTICVDVFEALEDATFGDLMPDGWTLFCVTCTTPEQGGHGPARHRYMSPAAIGNSGEAAIMDSAVINVQYGGSIGGQPVAGGQRVSGIPFSQLDCNVIDDTWSEAFGNAWFDAFDEVRLVNGSPWQRAILHQPAGGPDAFVNSTDQGISNRVGVRIDRVGNRSNNRPAPVPVP